MEDLGAGAEIATTTVGADGAFTFFGVPAGAYMIDARRTVSQFTMQTPLNSPPVPQLPATPGPVSPGGGSTIVMSGPEGLYYSTSSSPSSETYWALTPIEVGTSDVTDARVVMRPSVSLSGRAVFETAAPTPSNGPPFVSVSAEPADGSRNLGSPRSTRDPANPTAFRLDGLLAGPYFLRVAGGGAVKSITWDGRDMTSTPFDASAGRDFTDITITLTDQRTALGGIVRDARGAPAAAAVVLAFPAERAQWTNFGFNPPRIRLYPTSSNGSYRYQSLPAGDYLVVALPIAQRDGWKSAGFLDIASRVATPVTLEWGGNKSLDLKVSQIK
jgi:hypothetical protein